MIRCETCGGSGWVSAPSGGRRRTKVVLNGQTFETSAAALPFNSGGFSPSRQDAPSDFGGMLSPGETRRSTLYHQWSTGDVWVSGLIAIVSGSLVGLSSVPICIAAHVRWYWPFVIWTGTTTIVWVLKAWDFFTDDKAITHHQEQ